MTVCGKVPGWPWETSPLGRETGREVGEGPERFLEVTGRSQIFKDSKKQEVGPGVAGLGGKPAWDGG